MLWRAGQEAGPKREPTLRLGCQTFGVSLTRNPPAASQTRVRRPIFGRSARANCTCYALDVTRHLQTEQNYASTGPLTGRRIRPAAMLQRRGPGQSAVTLTQLASGTRKTDYSR